MDTRTIQNLIEQGLPGAQVRVAGDDGVHFEALVVSAAFAGCLPIKRQRMVYTELADLMEHGIHALSMDVSAKQSQIK